MPESKGAPARARAPAPLLEHSTRARAHAIQNIASQVDDPPAQKGEKGMLPVSLLIPRQILLAWLFGANRDHRRNRVGCGRFCRRQENRAAQYRKRKNKI